MHALHVSLNVIYVTLQMVSVSLKSAVHEEAHARAERLKNKLYGLTLNSNRAYGGKIR